MTDGALKYPPTKKIHTLGALQLIAAGDLAQAQKALRVLPGLASIEGFLDALDDLHISQTEWLVADPDRIALITQGDGGAYSEQSVADGTWGVIGSGALFVEGYLAAYEFPGDPECALQLCKDAIRACSRRMLCVGGPVRGRIIPCP